MNTGDTPAAFTPNAIQPAEFRAQAGMARPGDCCTRTPRYELASYQVSKSVRVSAPPAKVYKILVDYNDGHRQILPPKYFGPVTVEQGGIGDGTVISFTMRVFGQTRMVRAEITEPVPGSQMVERDLDTGVTTVFDVMPAGGGDATDVTITTILDAREGLGGAAERALTRWLLPRIFGDELERLRDYARK